MQELRSGQARSWALNSGKGLSQVFRILRGAGGFDGISGVVPLEEGGD